MAMLKVLQGLLCSVPDSEGWPEGCALMNYQSQF